MQNIIKFVKDKSYYFLGGTVLILVIMIAISACSSNFSSSYTSIENKMVSSAKKYYNSNPNLLPKEVGGKVRVSIATLVDEELIKEVYDVKDKNNKCSGYVEVTKVEDDYSYIPFLTCKGNYEPNNCRWAGVIEQNNNQKSNVSFEYKGETHTLAEWARLYGIKYHCFYARWKKNQNPEYLFRGYRRVDND